MKIAFTETDGIADGHEWSAHMDNGYEYEWAEGLEPEWVLWPEPNRGMTRLRYPQDIPDVVLTAFAAWRLSGVLIAKED